MESKLPAKPQRASHGKRCSLTRYHDSYAPREKIATSAALAGGIVAFVFRQGLHYFELDSRVILVVAGVASALAAASVAFATEPMVRRRMQAQFLAARNAFQRGYRYSARHSMHCSQTFPYLESVRIIS